jgi:hypothetical protein
MFVICLIWTITDKSVGSGPPQQTCYETENEDRKNTFAYEAATSGHQYHFFLHFCF